MYWLPLTLQHRTYCIFAQHTRSKLLSTTRQRPATAIFLHSHMASSAKYWLLKAEPDSRIVKGKDVKFSVDDFERVGTSPWEGVRNYEARNLMKEMKEGDRALFYHSNCKNPGIAAFAKVSKEAYPDYTAWDASHPYFDPKSDSSNPKWFMVDLTLTARAKNFIPLSLLRTISSAQFPDIPPEVAYLSEEDVKSIKAMDLINRGRLSVQRVQENAWKAIEQLAEKGGFPEQEVKSKATKRAPAKKKASSVVKENLEAHEDDAANDEVDEAAAPKKTKGPAKATKRKREPEPEMQGDTAGLRRSTRARK